MKVRLNAVLARVTSGELVALTAGDLGRLSEFVLRDVGDFGRNSVAAR